jgi:thiamine pyrophosphokinase
MYEQTVIIANGDINPGPAVDRILTLITMEGVPVIAADGGADNALELGLRPQVVVGDMDSVLPSTLTTLIEDGAEVFRFSHAKDETDLELALIEAVKRGARWIRIIGAMGGRIDQTMGNIQLLSHPDLSDVDARLVSGGQTLWLAPPGRHPLMGNVGDTISLLPFHHDVTGIVTNGLEYPLENETLFLGPARGMSNVILTLPATVAFVSGVLTIVHTVGRA